MLVRVFLSILREPPWCQWIWHFTQTDWQGLQVAIKTSGQVFSISCFPPLIWTQHENSSTETCSLLCTNPFYLIISYPTLLPSYGTLNPVVRHLLWNNFPSLTGMQSWPKVTSDHSTRHGTSVRLLSGRPENNIWPTSWLNSQTSLLLQIRGNTGLYR